MEHKTQKVFHYIGLAVLAAVVCLAENEVSVTEILTVKNGDYTQTKSVSQFRADQLGRSMTAQIQSIQTSAWEQVTIGADVSTNGWAYFRNITTNSDRWIELATVFRAAAVTGYVSFARLDASYPGVMPLHPTNAVFARAFGTNDISITTGVNLEYWVNEQ